MPTYPHVIAVMPALDEAGSIGAVIKQLFAQGIGAVIVADNGSRDDTVLIAKKAGAHVVHAARRGYGSACLAGLSAIPSNAEAVLFCDADGADDLSQVPALVEPVLGNTYDLVIGSRVLGNSVPGALSGPQRMGNFVAACLMRVLYRVRVTDLGPFRCISRHALAQLHMEDPAFGWTAEMQVKAFRFGLRVHEIPVDAQVRTAGESKISGRWWPIIQAGRAIIGTILYYWRAPIATTVSDTTMRVGDTLRDVETCSSCTSTPRSGK